MICYPWGGTVSNNSEGKHIIYHPHSLKCIIERFGVFFFNVWSFYDTTVHKETVSLMAEFQTQNVWKFRDPFCGSGHSMLAFFLLATWVTLFQVKTTTRRWRGGGPQSPSGPRSQLSSPRWAKVLRGASIVSQAGVLTERPRALQSAAVTSSHCSAQLMPCLSWQAPVTLRHHTSASTKHTFGKVWATEGTYFRGCQGKPALSINSREAVKQPRGTDTRRTAGPECKEVFCFLCMDRGKKRQSKIPFDQAKVGLAVSLNLPSGVKIQQITPQMCSFKQITSFFLIPSVFFFL